MTGDADWPLAGAVMPVLPSGTTSVFLQGTLGSLFQSQTVPALYSDLQTLYIPGLSAFGIDARVERLPEERDSLAATLQALPRPNALPLYRFEGEPFPDSESENDDIEPAAEPEPGVAARLAEQDLGRVLAQAGLLREVREDAVVWQDVAGETQTSTLEDFRAAFTWIVPWQRSSGRAATRRVSLVGAVQRAVVFALAFPDRFLTDEDADAKRRENAAQFLRDAAGKQRDPISLRWRQAGDLLADGRTQAALDRLYDSAVRTLNLPEPVLEILAAGGGAPLSNIQRRELIYLARAGNDDLKVLAARRLAGEQWSTGVRQTLDQLAAARDPLVRAAARGALSADVADKRR